ncbi:hypothetical protein OH809_06190 [Streptomyces sp. NBC_00873]|nr:hypothetical protein OH809_06190 [Streptomyces sp. NBC_00873]WTA47611.1 hypothetical protein OH821_37580 [Streptomyces sp. NBC_00842]
MSRPTGWRRSPQYRFLGGALVADSTQIPGGLLCLMSTGARTERAPAGHP